VTRSTVRAASPVAPETSPLIPPNAFFASANTKRVVKGATRSADRLAHPRGADTKRGSKNARTSATALALPSLSERTKATEEELSDFQAAGKGATMAVEMALKLVRSWDLKREETDKEPIPLTREELRTVPTTVLSMIFEAIAEDRRPNAET